VHFGLQRLQEFRYRCRLIGAQGVLKRQCGGMQGGRTQGSGGTLEGVQSLPGGFGLACGKRTSQELRIESQ
jgi:hypothetical protein